MNPNDSPDQLFGVGGLYQKIKTKQREQDSPNKQNSILGEAWKEDDVAQNKKFAAKGIWYALQAKKEMEEKERMRRVESNMTLKSLAGPLPKIMEGKPVLKPRPLENVYGALENRRMTTQPESLARKSSQKQLKTGIKFFSNLKDLMPMKIKSRNLTPSRSEASDRYNRPSTIHSVMSKENQNELLNLTKAVKTIALSRGPSIARNIVNIGSVQDIYSTSNDILRSELELDSDLKQSFPNLRRNNSIEKIYSAYSSSELKSPHKTRPTQKSHSHYRGVISEKSLERFDRTMSSFRGQVQINPPPKPADRFV